MIKPIQMWVGGSLSLLGHLLDQEPGVLFRFFWLFFLFDLPWHLISNCYILFNTFFSSEKRAQKENRREIMRRKPLVSIIVPAWNEEAAILQTISSLEKQNYPHQEIIVVNDGSSDGTHSICRNLAHQGRIRYFPLRVRSGKSAALNYGVRFSRGEFIVFVDSDSFFDPDAIRNLIGYFNDPEVGAVAGNLKVANHHQNLWTELQSLEYLLIIGLGRRIRASLGILPVISGALGGFRASLITASGGHDPGPGNDSDLTVKIRKTGMKVAFAPNAVCFTRVPDSGYSFIKQRLRWSRCLISIRIRKHRSVFFPWNSNFDSANLLATTEPVFSHLILTGATLFYIIDMVVHFPLIFPAILMVNYFLFLCITSLDTLIALSLSDWKREDISCLAYLFMYHPYIWFHKMVRLVAYIQETLFYSSYRDPFAPRKVRRSMNRW